MHKNKACLSRSVWEEALGLVVLSFGDGLVLHGVQGLLDPRVQQVVLGQEVDAQVEKVLALVFAARAGEGRAARRQDRPQLVRKVDAS